MKKLLIVFALLFTTVAFPTTSFADGHCEAGADACLDEAGDDYDEVYDCMRGYEACTEDSEN